MSTINVTVGFPIPDDATEEDAKAMGDLVERLIFGSTPLTGEVVWIELVQGDRLGSIGAYKLLSELRRDDGSL